jgi:small subunit ribosomal protein S6
MSHPSSHVYETVYILKSGLSDTDASAIHTKVDNVITKFSGQVKTRDDWGLKELAYPIEDETMGKFSVVVYNGQSGVVEEIERHFKILSDVVRFITVSVPEDYDYSKVKKQIALSEEEMKKAREMRKKGQ